MSEILGALEVKRADSIDAQVTRKLLEYLLSGAVQAGERLPPERALAAELDVGRQSVRNALKSLTMLGIVESRVGSGTYFIGPRFNLVPQVIEWSALLGEVWGRDLIEARTQLEIMFAGLAATRRSPRQLDELRAIVQKMAEATDDYRPYAEADGRFHLKIAEMSGSTLLSGVLRNIGGLLTAWSERVVSSAGETGTSLTRHVDILRAIEDQDPERARMAMTAHMERAQRRLVDSLSHVEVRTSAAGEIARRVMEAPTAVVPEPGRSPKAQSPGPTVPRPQRIK